MEGPLSQLRDIHLPEPVGLWPLAPGWWLLAALLLVTGVIVFRLIRNRVRRDAPRRDALKELEKCYRAFEDDGNESKYISNINVLLKKVAAFYYGKEKVARLSGEAWLAFLDQHAGTDQFSRGAGTALASGPYRPAAAVDAVALQQACKHWVDAHD